MLALAATKNQIIDAAKNEIADTRIQKIHNKNIIWMCNYFNRFIILFKNVTEISIPRLVFFPWIFILSELFLKVYDTLDCSHSKLVIQFSELRNYRVTWSAC